MRLASVYRLEQRLVTEVDSSVRLVGFPVLVYHESLRHLGLTYNSLHVRCISHQPQWTLGSIDTWFALFPTCSLLLQGKINKSEKLVLLARNIKSEKLVLRSRNIKSEKLDSYSLMDNTSHLNIWTSQRDYMAYQVLCVYIWQWCFSRYLVQLPCIWDSATSVSTSPVK